MSILKGGRGKKAPWPVTHVRCPEPIKAEVQRLIDQWKEQELTGNGGDSIKPLTSSQMQEIIQSELNRKKSARVTAMAIAKRLGYTVKI